MIPLDAQLNEAVCWVQRAQSDANSAASLMQNLLANVREAQERSRDLEGENMDLRGTIEELRTEMALERRRHRPWWRR